jgi:hypothetical protein
LSLPYTGVTVLLQRVFAFVILAAFIGGPASRLDCLLSCGAIEVAERTASCHSTKSADLAFDEGADHCDNEDAFPIVIAVKRSDVQSHPSGLLPTEVPRSMTSGTVRRSAGPPPPLAPPLTAFLIPLRI